MTLHHIWFDPGKTTGYAIFEDNVPKQMGELLYPAELYDFLGNMSCNPSLDIIGYENYRLRPIGHDDGWTPIWDEVIPIRVIGAIELAGFIANPNQIFRSQEPSCKPAGYGYANLGKYDPDKKGMHMQDAIAHGAFFFMENHLAIKKSSSAQRGWVPSNPGTRSFRSKRRT